MFLKYASTISFSLISCR